MKIRRWAVVALFAVTFTFTFAGAALASGTSRAAGEAVIAPVADEPALRVSGRFGEDLESQLRAWLGRYPQTQVLVVRSPGGLRWQALEVAELVNARGITVRIEGRCASACALLWAAADSREMTFDSRLGLHGSRLPAWLPLPAGVRGWIVAYNDRQTNRVLRAAGFPQRLIEQGHRTPPTAMSWYDAAELQLGGVPFVLRGDGRSDQGRRLPPLSS